MAAIQTIQRHPAILTTILGAGLILMIIMFGFDDYNGFFQGDRDTVLSVNDEKVSWAQYETERQHQSDFIQAFYNQDVNKAENSHRINEDVYNQFVQEKILNKELDEMGITVCDAEINELTTGSHTSTVLTRMFGQSAQAYGQTFAQLVATNGFEEFQQNYNAPYMTYNNWLVIENQIKNTRKAEKFTALLNAAVKPNKLEALDVYNGENTDVAFSYVTKRAITVADSLVKVENKDLKAYYENHKEAFKQQSKTREISYIAVALHPSEDDRNNALENLQKAMPEFTEGDVKEVVSANSAVGFIDAYLNDETWRGELKEFVDGNAAGAVSEPKIYNGDILALLGEHSENDESLSEYYWMARIIGKQNAPDSIKLIIAGAATEHEQDSLYAVVRNGGQDSLANWATNLNLMSFEDGLRDKIAAAKKGETFKYDFSNNGQQVYVVAKVIDMTANVAQSKVAVYAEKINPSSKTRRTEYGRLNEFTTEFPTIAQMQDSALTRGYRMLDYTVATNNYSINQVKECRQAIRFAFDGKKGDISEIYEESGYLLVIGIKGEIEEGYVAYDNDQVSSYIRMMVMPEKKVAYLANQFNSVADKTLEGYATAMNETVQEATRVNFNMNTISGLSNEPKVIAAAVKNAEGSVVGPIEGNNSVTVIKVGAKTQKGLEFDEAAYKAKVSSPVYNNAANAANQALRNGAKIVDNRIKFY